MSRVGALLMALVAIVPFSAVPPASAHGPTRQKVVETIEINAPADKVWEVLGNFQDMGWHPAFAKTEGTGGNDPGATRKLTLAAGGTMDEKLTKYDGAGRSFAYEIPEVDVKLFPVANYAATISVKDAGGKSTVEWKASFYRGYGLNDPPPELSDEAAVKAVTDLAKSGLAALKKKLEGSG